MFICEQNYVFSQPICCFLRNNRVFVRERCFRPFFFACFFFHYDWRNWTACRSHFWSSLFLLTVEMEQGQNEIRGEINPSIHLSKHTSPALLYENVQSTMPCVKRAHTHKEYICVRVCVFVCLPTLCGILCGLRKMNQPLRILSFLNFWSSDFWHG